MSKDKAIDEEHKTLRVKTQTYTKLLACELTNEERIEAAKRLTELMDDLTAKEDELTSIKAQFKDDMTTLESEIKKVKRITQTGRQYRDVEVVEEKNYDTGRVRVVRMDTSETIEDRKLLDSELQMTLPNTEDMEAE